MEASDHFERALFYDRSTEAESHYEIAAEMIFDDSCSKSPIEVWVESCRKFCVVETEDDDEHFENRRYGRKDALSVIGDSAVVSDQFSASQTGRTAAWNDQYSLTRSNTKFAIKTPEDVITDNCKDCSVSSRVSHPISSPTIDQDRVSAEPPLYPGPAELDVLQLMPSDIEDFVQRTKNNFRVFYIRQRHSHSRLQITKGTFERLLGSCHVFPRFTEYVYGLSSSAEASPPPLKFRPVRSNLDSTYSGFGEFQISLVSSRMLMVTGMLLYHAICRIYATRKRPKAVVVATVCTLP